MHSSHSLRVCQQRGDLSLFLNSQPRRQLLSVNFWARKWGPNETVDFCPRRAHIGGPITLEKMTSAFSLLPDALLLIINKWHDFYQSGFCTTANNLGIKVHDVFFILSSVGLLMFIHEAVSLEAFRFFGLCFDNRINDRFCVQRMVCLNGWSWSEKKQCDKKIDLRIPSRISRVSFAVCCNWITWEQFSLQIEGGKEIYYQKKKKGVHFAN